MLFIEYPESMISPDFPISTQKDEDIVSRGLLDHSRFRIQQADVWCLNEDFIIHSWGAIDKLISNPNSFKPTRFHHNVFNAAGHIAK